MIIIYRILNPFKMHLFINQDNELDNSGYEYEFRGRLNEMQSNLTALRNLSWIDSLTRVVIIQLTLYNPNVELFTSITFLSEFLSTGGACSSISF